MKRDRRWYWRRRSALGLALLAVLMLPLCLPTGLPLWAQRRRDPLNPLEIDQLRDAMLDPDLRLKLYVQFSRDRMTKLEQMRSNPKTTDRARQTHDMLEEFLAVYDELNDNVEMYVGRKDDIRRPLKMIIEADVEFQAKLRALKDAANTNSAEAKQYEFLLTDALDTVDSSVDDHRKTVAEVEQYMKKKKKK
ncbi:MAG TPA: hypothetical protein VKH18_09395 [Terriglobales bacterium]|nr:hypothetical protein [Terriglobales bacterium]